MAVIAVVVFAVLFLAVACPAAFWLGRRHGEAKQPMSQRRIDRYVKTGDEAELKQALRDLEEETK